MIERLESRTHLAHAFLANAIPAHAVHVTITRAAVTVRGTDAAETLEIDAVPGSGSADAEVTRGYRIFAGDAVPLFVNGKRLEARYVEFGENDPVTARPLRIKLGGGDDVVRVHTSAVFSQLTIDTAAGDDYVYGAGVRAAVIGIDSGTGDDRIELGLEQSFPDRNGDLLAVSNGVAVYPGPGRDRVRLSDPVTYALPSPTCVIDGKLLVKDVQGRTDLTLEGLRVKRQTVIDTANAADRITLDRCRFIRSIAVMTHKGADSVVAVNGTGFRGGVTIDLGGQADDRASGIPGL